MSDPYALPNGTLRNRFGIEDAAALARAEAEATANRLMQISKDPVRGGFDFDHLKAIHKAIFQDVYDFAGVPRITTLARPSADGRSHEFTHPILIEKDGAALFKGLAQMNFHKGRSAHVFAHEAAGLLSELNQLHPFREGNGRTQRQFLKDLAKAAGHELDFSVVTRERNKAVAIAATAGDLEPMRWMLVEAIDPIMSAPARDGIRHYQSRGLDVHPAHVESAQPGRSYEGTLAGRNGDFFMMRAANDTRVIFGRTADIAPDARVGDAIRIQATLPSERQRRQPAR